MEKFYCFVFGNVSECGYRYFKNSVDYILQNKKNHEIVLITKPVYINRLCNVNDFLVRYASEKVTW